MKRVAAYCRVSTDKDDQVNSLDSQKRYFAQYIERNPLWELCEVYVDESVIFEPSQKPLAAQGFLVWFNFFVPPQWATMT